MGAGIVPPSGTVTFLFTDIEGSSRLWQEHAVEITDALERHDAIVRHAIATHDGYVFTTAGDSFAAAFSRAADAVAAAVGAQQRLVAEPWSTATPLKVRMGLCSGEAYERNGDYFGTAVNRAARIMGLGSGGQILMSALTRDLSGSRNSPRPPIRPAATRRRSPCARCRDPPRTFPQRGSYPAVVTERT